MVLGICGTQLPLGDMVVEGRLGGAAASAFPVVDVEEATHLSRELHESVWVAVHITRGWREGVVGKGRGVSLGMG